MIIDFTNVLYMNWLLVIHSCYLYFYLIIMSIFKLFYAPVKIIFLYVYCFYKKEFTLSCLFKCGRGCFLKYFSFRNILK